MATEWREHSIALGGLPLRVLRGGAGRPVLVLHHDIGTPDGKFGQKTQDAVTAFQTAHNLKPDGIVGGDTAQAINDAVASSAG